MHAKVNRTLKNLHISRKNVSINKEINFTQYTIAKNTPSAMVTQKQI